uniref:Uncharacterized protein n=1 Tax=Pseudomonas aeruginosa TaxID=287 RepID=B3G1T0_PSEAI|nr:hypothetical protein PACL_0204 [Pseudomonas aeruginosa]
MQCQPVFAEQEAAKPAVLGDPMQTNPGQRARSWLRSVLASCRSIHLARPHIVVPSASSSQSNHCGI